MSRRQLRLKTREDASAYMSGADARRAGKNPAACPYQPTTGARRALQRAWLRGWSEVKPSPEVGTDAPSEPDAASAR